MKTSAGCLLLACLLPSAGVSAPSAVAMNPEPSHADAAKHRADFAVLRAAPLEAKITYLLDRAEITDLVTAYAYSVDTRDWSLHKSIFTETYEISTNGKFSRQTAEQRGAALAEYFKKFEATQHLMIPLTFEIHGDGAYVTASMHARHFHSDGDPGKNTLLFGQYEFWCKRTAEGWRIEKMSMVNRTHFPTSAANPTAAAPAAKPVP